VLIEAFVWKKNRRAVFYEADLNRVLIFLRQAKRTTPACSLLFAGTAWVDRTFYRARTTWRWVQSTYVRRFQHGTDSWEIDRSSRQLPAPLRAASASRWTRGGLPLLGVLFTDWLTLVRGADGHSVKTYQSAAAAACQMMTDICLTWFDW